jgi:hypothetical protein
MQISPGVDDAPEFISVVEHLAGGIAVSQSPKNLVLIKIDNWFGSRWLGFAGKVLGAVGVWHRDSVVTVPPFVPNRVVSQRRFSAPDYHETALEDPIHRAIPSSVAVQRKLSEVAPNSAVLWYPGKSEITGRGSVMAYIPATDSYWTWYAGWKRERAWSVAETWDITRDELERTIDLGRALSL